jgi:dodecin
LTPHTLTIQVYRRSRPGFNRCILRESGQGGSPPARLFTGGPGAGSSAATFSPDDRAIRECCTETRRILPENNNMTMLKVIEVLAESEKSWDDAATNAVAHAAKTVRNIKSIYVENFQATVENNEIVKYRINAKISFTLE